MPRAGRADLSGQSSGVGAKEGVTEVGVMKPALGPSTFQMAHHGGLQLPTVCLEVSLNSY